jgi:nucleoside-diphosphate-sugar epimerase
MPEMIEDAPLTGYLDTPYAITKLLGEQYCRYYSSFYGLNVVIARLFNSYGPGEKPGQYRNVIPNFFSKAIKKESLIVTGTGYETRDFTYVGDIVQGLFKLCIKPTQPGEVFNLGSGQKVSINHLVKIINEISKNTAPILYKPRRDWDHVEHRVANIQKAKSFIKYVPTHSLQEGLVATYDWICKGGF